MVFPFGNGYQVWSFPLLNKPAYDTKMAKTARFYRHVELYEHYYMKSLQKELAEIAARLAAEQSAKEAAELAAQQAEIDAANAAAFGPPPTETDSEGEKDSTGSHGSEASEGSQRSAADAENPEGGEKSSSKK